MKKGIICVLVCMLMILSIIVPVSGTVLTEKTTHPLTKGNTLYVGGSGPNNYTKIQDAINDATNGDTVFVYDDSSPYLENIIVNKSIQLIGENKQTTVIDGEGKEDVVSVTANGISISGFSILGKKTLFPSQWYCGIQFWNVTQCTIRDNIVQNNLWIGIRSWKSSNCTVADNIVIGNGYGISIDKCSDYNVTGNLVKDNIFVGIFVAMDYNIIIQGNNLSSNNLGVHVVFSSDTQVLKNNFIANFIDATFGTSLTGESEHRTNWQGNYWDQRLGSVKLIVGRIVLVPWINIDWHPAQEPYDIGV